MHLMSTKSKTVCALVALTIPFAASAQTANDGTEVLTTVHGSNLPKGPEIEGIITARGEDSVLVTTTDGNRTEVFLDRDTEIKAKGGFLGLSSDKLTFGELYNGIPVSIETLQIQGGLLADKIALKSKDLKTAQMIHNGTDQRFTRNEAATEALRGRMGDIDKYNIKGVTNVYFDTAKYNLTGQARADLCAAASQAEATDNALLLVVGYTDATGDYEFNQELSEKRATRVVNFLQQECGWKPYRMLTPTGMAEADPAADNTTEEGKAQNRRVAVNILVSKSVDGL